MDTLKLFCCDLNWSCVQKGDEMVSVASAPQDWYDIDPAEYYNWHKDMGCNITFCQAYAFSGYAFYPSKLGPLAPGKGSRLLPELFELSRRDNQPFCSYFCVGTDLILSSLRDIWVIPEKEGQFGCGMLAPETEWTDLLCERIKEFLSMYPVEYLLFDWMVYGDLKPDAYKIEPQWFMKDWFRKIIGREMPETGAEITEKENLKYKREILAMQFYRIKDAVKSTSPDTKIIFNVPYWEANEKIWEDHPMMNESDLLFAESSDKVVDWLLSVKKPHQRVMTTIIGRPESGLCDPNSWEKWYKRGCDFFGYAWGTPPDFRPLSRYKKDLEIVTDAFKKIK